MVLKEGEDGEISLDKGMKCFPMGSQGRKIMRWSSEYILVSEVGGWRRLQGRVAWPGWGYRGDPSALLQATAHKACTAGLPSYQCPKERLQGRKDCEPCQERGLTIHP